VAEAGSALVGGAASCAAGGVVVVVASAAGAAGDDGGGVVGVSASAGVRAQAGLPATNTALANAHVARKLGMGRIIDALARLLAR
jgi:hypothetical protein